ncbi:MAG: VOC family protein [Bacteroidetes bacterium]|nr:VOC family protein [Bacteroidota bacterium]
MIIEHIAIWAKDLERMKGFYCRYLKGKAGEKYTNEKKQFQSYFITFESGARLELMHRPDISAKLNEGAKQHLGITHMAFGVSTMKEVDDMAVILAKAGSPILSGPRKTGDGYYEFETLDPEENRLEVSTYVGTILEKHQSNEL